MQRDLYSFKTFNGWMVACFPFHCVHACVLLSFLLPILELMRAQLVQQLERNYCVFPPVVLLRLLPLVCPWGLCWEMERKENKYRFLLN